MWRNDRDRPDDPRTRERETQRLARDEYDRPRYGSPQQGDGDRPAERSASYSQGETDVERILERTGDPRAWNHGGPTQVEPRGQAAAPPYGTERLHPDRAHLENLHVDELMTRRVTSVHPATSVERAVRLMAECDCGALPVVGDNGVLVGVVTDRDVAIRIVARGRDARTAIVADCMTERVFACFANESVAECMRQMARRQVRRMPVVDDRGRLMGIVAQGDLARHAGHHAILEEERALTEVVCAVSQPAQTPSR